MSIAEKLTGKVSGMKRGGIAEAMEGRASAGSPAPAAPEVDAGGGHSELHDHGDGTFHTVLPSGVRTEHPALGHALAHIGKEHDPENLAELKESFDQYLSEEGAEGAPEGGEESLFG